jgi:glycosyltransferase involved in cell wall biosynthesis
MKILFLTNRVNNYVPGFHNVISVMQELGHETIWAANFCNLDKYKDKIPCKIRQVSINSYPLNRGNVSAYKKLKIIIKSEEVDAIYCTTPIGSFLGRLLGKKFKQLIILYAAHGFLFFKGAPLINRTLYKWEEQYLARYTDVLITITDEDYLAAKHLKLRNNGNLYRIHGAGVEVGEKVVVDKTLKRNMIGVAGNSFLIVSAGFLNDNKNNEVIIKSISLMKNKTAYYVVCGDGERAEQLRKLARDLKLSSRIIFLGYRSDVKEIMAVSDCFAMPSFREGVPRSLLEAMDLGIPCVGSDTRGIRDLIGKHEEGGILCNPHDPQSFACAFETLLNATPDNLLKMKKRNQQEAKKYSNEVVRAEIKEIINKELIH